MSPVRPLYGVKTLHITRTSLRPAKRTHDKQRALESEGLQCPDLQEVCSSADEFTLLVFRTASRPPGCVEPDVLRWRTHKAQCIAGLAFLSRIPLKIAADHQRCDPMCTVGL